MNEYNISLISEKNDRNPIVFYFQWILLILSIIILTLSLIAFIIIMKEAFKLTFDFSSIGFQNYLKLYKPYSSLFTSLVIVITAYLAIMQLMFVNESNKTAYKISNRTLWMQTVKEFLLDVKSDNPIMYKEFSKNLLNIHDYLFERKYAITNKEQNIRFFF